mmetsp:Transcript_12642/g.26774  ORF Transcript_12642/g.26774 Transcript_12642/m.26774 type:complete len:598 (-) Transcript_12642:44-1837(-)
MPPNSIMHRHGASWLLVLFLCLPVGEALQSPRNLPLVGSTCRISQTGYGIPHNHCVDISRSRQISLYRTRSTGICTATPSARLAATALDAGDEQNDNSKVVVVDYEWTKQTFEIGVPALIGMIADPLLSLVDTGFVGRLGAIPLAALGACTSIFHLAFNAFRATTTATTSLVATALSTHGRDQKENEEEARIVTDTSLRLGLTIGAVVLAALSLGWSRALGAMGIGEGSELINPAQSYLRIRALAAPAVLLISVAEGAFRGYGNTRIPLLASFVAAITNLVLDPIFMFPMKMEVGGAAAATAISQIVAASVYMLFLRRRKMLPQEVTKNEAAATETIDKKPLIYSPKPSIDRTRIVLEILKANAAMFFKQGSLLFGWAFATGKATRLGHFHVAAHQIALSFWLIFALILDGSAVSAQVLMSRNYAAYQSNVCDIYDKDEEPGVCRGARHSIRSLSVYMLKFALVQGFLSTLLIFGLGQFAPSVFTTDPTIRLHLNAIIPHLAWQQVLISLTLVAESLAIGGSKFNLIAVGTAISTVVAVKILNGAKNIVEIWSGGIVALFVGRLVTALIGVLDLNGAFHSLNKWLAPTKILKKRHVE